MWFLRFRKIFNSFSYSFYWIEKKISCLGLNLKGILDFWVTSKDRISTSGSKIHKQKRRIKFDSPQILSNTQFSELLLIILIAYTNGSLCQTYFSSLDPRHWTLLQYGTHAANYLGPIRRRSGRERKETIISAQRRWKKTEVERGIRFPSQNYNDPNNSIR